MADVTIMGAGILGLSAGFALLQAGARVQIIDPQGPGGGASGGLVGALAPHTPDNWNAKKAFQLDSLLAADAFWAAVEAASDLPSGYARTGRVQILPTPRSVELAHERAKTSRAFWPDHLSWQVLRTDEVPVWQVESPTGYVAYDTLSAHLHPRQACASLAAAIKALCGQIDREAAPTGDKTLWATGIAGLHALGPGIGKAVKGQAAVLDADLKGAPQIYGDGLHIIPHADGTTAIGSTSENTFEDGFATDHLLEDVIARARNVAPQLKEVKILTRWAGLRPRAATRAPVLGPWPGRPGHYVANGGFKIGFGIAPGIAYAMRDLILNDRDAIPHEFRVEKLMEHADATGSP